MDTVDDIFPPYNFSPWDPSHLGATFALAPSQPDTDIPHQHDHSIFSPPPNPTDIPTDNPADNPLPDPADISPELSAAFASNFALPNSLSFIPPNLSHLQQQSSIISQSLPTDHPFQQPSQFNDPALSLLQTSPTLDVSPIPTHNQNLHTHHQQPPVHSSARLSPHPQLNPHHPASAPTIHPHSPQQSSHQSQLHHQKQQQLQQQQPQQQQPQQLKQHHDERKREQQQQRRPQQRRRQQQRQQQQQQQFQRRQQQQQQQQQHHQSHEQHQHPHQKHHDHMQMQIQLQRSAQLMQRQHNDNHQSSHNNSRAKSTPTCSQQQSPRTQQPKLQKRQSQSAVHQPTRRNSLGPRSIQKQRSARQPKQQTQRQQKHQQSAQQKQELRQEPTQRRNSNVTATTHRQERNTNSQDRSQLSNLQKPSSQTHHNHLPNVSSTSAMPALSALSIPTPTIATGTTITGSPSTTNSTHRSPPRTPRSANPVKSTAISGTKNRHYEARSSGTKNPIERKARRPQSTASHVNKTSPSSSKLNATVATPTSASTSAQHTTVQHTTTAQHSASAPHSNQRISKPRDKHARLRKRLKCCTQDQLVDQLIELVRSATVPEKRLVDTMPRVDMGLYVLKCQELRDSILCQLPDDAAHTTPPFDATAYRRCKKALSVFRTSIVNMAKTLVEASLWTDVIEFCIAAEGVNAETPVWSEASHNKTKSSIRTKLEQFALKAATAMSKPKEAAAISPDDHARAMESCQSVFPNVVAKLKGQGASALTESQGRSQDFDDPMLSTTQLDIDM